MYEIVLRKKVVFFQYCNGNYDQTILIIEHILIKKTPVKNKIIQQKNPQKTKNKRNKKNKTNFYQI